MDLDDLALLHCEWALGLDRFAALRESRLAVGIPTDARPVDLVGEHGDRWVFRFSLPIERGKRTSAVRISAVREGVLVEHLVVHEVPSLPADPSADSPETTRALIDLPGVEPAMLRQLGPTVLGERDVPGLVAEALAPRRPAPIVLVSVDNGTREPLVDPHELARRLAGMVKVVWLSTVNASRRLKDELMTRGFSEKFGCFHGTATEAVALAEACFPERLIILPSARSSAGVSPFRDPSRILQVLALLAFFGRHDGDLEAALEKALGAQARWRPRDSPDTSARFGTQRTWGGGRKLFRRHITLGHGDDAQRCAQVYYDVTADGRIELAWVGEHPPTVSEDT